MTHNPTSRLSQLLGLNKTKWNADTYASRYERYFAPLKDRPLKILEIGIGGYEDPLAGGESLRAWKEYFPNAMIYGIDIVDKKALEEERIETFQGSQDDPDFLRRVVGHTGALDIVIDDGSHRNDHVIKSFQLLFPAMSEEGIYVVEDTHFSYLPSIDNWPALVPGDTPPGWALYGGSLDLYEKTTMVNFFKRLADCVSYQDFFNPGYEPNYFDLHLSAVHFYRNQIFALKGSNGAPGNLLINNTMRPEWLKLMGLSSLEQVGLQFPRIDDPTRWLGDTPA